MFKFHVLDTEGLVCAGFLDSKQAHAYADLRNRKIIKKHSRSETTRIEIALRAGTPSCDIRPTNSDNIPLCSVVAI